MKCKFCLNEYPKLVEAHIIPKAFFAFGSDGKERSRSKIISNKPGFFPKNAPQGVYDSGILCDVCEKKFAIWDDEAIKFFQKDLKQNYPVRYELKIYLQSEFNYKKFKLFFLSLLWRAHHSTHFFFEKVNLNKEREEEIRSFLFDDIEPDYLDYPVMMKRYNTNRVGARTIIHPIFSRAFGEIRRNYYAFFFASHVIMIKVDRRNWPDVLDEVILHPNKPLVVGITQFEGSPYHKIMMKGVNANSKVKFRK